MERDAECCFKVEGKCSRTMYGGMSYYRQQGATALPSVMSNMLHITDHTLPPTGREAFGIDAAEDIKGMGADCVVMAVSHDAFKKTFHKSFIKNCPSGGVCFYTFLHVKDISLSVLKGVMNSDPVLVDIRGMFCGEAAERMGFCYRGL